MTRDERFWTKVLKANGCWLWQASLSDSGHGRFFFGMSDGRTHVVRAHRYAYETLVGTVPAGLELDHLCRTPACVRPDHLEPVTHRENLRRSPIMGRPQNPALGCGTYAGYQRHWRRGDTPCQACRTASRDRTRAQRHYKAHPKTTA